MIHLASTNGKTLCSLLIRQAGVITEQPRMVNCPECKRLVEKLILTAPRPSNAHYHSKGFQNRSGGK